MCWLWTTLLAFGTTLLGFVLGRWYERSHITRDLLTSRDPTDWSSAHRITRGADVARFGDEDSGHYTPTPSRPFPALREKPSAALAPTIKAAREDVRRSPP